MSETPFYNELVVKYGDGNYDALKLLRQSFLRLAKEMGIQIEHDTGMSCQYSISIKQKEVYVIYVSGNGKECFYYFGNNRKLYFDDFDKPNYLPMVNIQRSEMPGVAIQGMIRGFTNGQLLLLHILNEKMRNKEPFTIEDARYIFAKAKKRGKQSCYVGKDHGWVMTEFDSGIELLKVRPDYYDYDMKPWLKINLGALMMKGVLVAIPVIQLGDDALKGLDHE